MLLGVDVGGTFTDAVLFGDRTITVAKAPTTPRDPSKGVLAAIGSVLAKSGSDGGRVARFAHGTTTGTNALLERRGARTALVATAGFTDLLEIARQDRPSLYRLCEDRPAPLIEPALRVAAAERVGPGGVVSAIDDAELGRIASAVAALEPESVAVCLLFSYLEPAHERAVAERLRAELGDVHVSASSEVLPRMREYERASTTVIDAYLAPLLAGYLRRLAAATGDSGLPAPLLMSSGGGVLGLEEATAGGAWSVLSGPAGGAVGAGVLARLSGDGNALGFDMGGTSCDVCVIDGGEVRRSGEREIAGRPIQLPMVDVHTVGAGGGSIGRRDPGGALKVGPESAGADPGPACYGRGGSEPTTTDANLLLGLLGAGNSLAGGIELDHERAEAAVGRLATELGLGLLETAEGMIRVTNGEMVRALRIVTVERGIDPRRYALLPFGGAGGLHAAAIATELGIGTVLCPRGAGVLSALGLVAAGERRELARTVLLSGEALNREQLAIEVGELGERLGVATDGERLEASYGLRYRGQSFELTIAGGANAEPGSLREAFAAEHERRYGYRDPDGEVELATITLARVVAGPNVVPAAADAEPERSERQIRHRGEAIGAAVLRGELPQGFELAGPCVAELPESTLFLPPGWAGAVDAHGTIIARVAA